MYRGRTLIELTNTNTGRVDKIESHNVFRADNIAKILAPTGMYKNDFENVTRYSNYANEPFWKYLLGGIHLYDQAIDEEAEYTPAGVKMMANGVVDLTSNGKPTELGSYNSSESSISKNAITMVWDWTTSQANGTIGSVCLVPYDLGLTGIGNGSKTYDSSTLSKLGGNIYTNRLTLGSTNSLPLNNKLVRISDSGSLTMNTSTGSLPYWTRAYNYRSMDLISDMGNVNTINLSGNTLYDEYHTISYDTTGYNRFYGPWLLEDRFRWILFNSGSNSQPDIIGPGGTLHYMDFLVDSETIEYNSATNTSGATITLNPKYNGHYGTNTWPQFLQFLNKDEMLFVANPQYHSYSSVWPKFSGSLYYMNTDTGDSQLVETRTGESDTSDADWFWYKQVQKAPNSLTVADMNRNIALKQAPGRYVVGGYYRSTTCVYDVLLNELMPINSMMYNGYIGDINERNFIHMSGGYTDSYPYEVPVCDRNLLCTINNISPVTKTSSQTMKVVYTLEREDT